MSNRYHVAPEDLANMVEIARVSSYEPDKLHWTELALYYRDDPARPWVPVVEGRTDALDMSNRFKAAAMGTIERAMSWFEGSNLRDQLADKVDERIGDCNARDWARDRLQVQGYQREAAARDPHHAAAIKHFGGEIPMLPPGDEIKMTRIPVGGDYHAVGDFTLSTTPPGDREGFVPIITGKRSIGGTLRVVGITTDTLTDVLKWLYPDAPSDSARTLLLERDFGMPARTARRALAVEDGGVQGEPGAWVNMFVVAMRFFDRELWMAGQATIANVES